MKDFRRLKDGSIGYYNRSFTSRSPMLWKSHKSYYMYVNLPSEHSRVIEIHRPKTGCGCLHGDVHSLGRIQYNSNAHEPLLYSALANTQALQDC